MQFKVFSERIGSHRSIPQHTKCFFLHQQSVCVCAREREREKERDMYRWWERESERCIGVYVCVREWCIWVCVRKIYIFTRVYVWVRERCIRVLCVCVCMCMCMCVYARASVCERKKYMCTCVYVCERVCECTFFSCHLKLFVWTHWMNKGHSCRVGSYWWPVHLQFHSYLSLVRSWCRWVGCLLKRRFFWLFDCFYVRPSDFSCSLFKVRWDVIGCINHGIVITSVLSYLWDYPTTSLLGMVKSFWSHMGIEPRSFRLWSVYSTPRPER